MQNAVSVFVCTRKSVKDPRQGRYGSRSARTARRNVSPNLAPTWAACDTSSSRPAAGCRPAASGAAHSGRPKRRAGS